MDAAALERFYREHLEGVKQFLARRVDDPFLLADLTADVFIAAIDSAASYDEGRGSPRAWLCGIARNLVAAEGRRAGREHRAIARIAGRELLDSEELLRLHERIDAAASGRALYRAMDRLSDSERAVLELVALDGLDVREAAAALGITAVAARVRLHRARRLLQAELHDRPLDCEVTEVLQ